VDPLTPATPSAEFDVLIVGYGPVGAALAGLLGSYGVRTLIVDRAPGIVVAPRAISLDNEALRILQMVGLREDAFARTLIPCVRMHSPYIGEFARINTAGAIDGHPKLVTFYQPDLERALRANVARQRSVTVRSGVRMVDITECGELVQVVLRNHGTKADTVVCTRYLVGADGAASAVRSAIGENFQGKSYAEDWLIVDALDVPTPIDHIEFRCDPARPMPHMVAPGGRTRWEFMLRRSEDREHMEKDSTVASLLKPWAGSADIRIERKAVYRFHARVCSRFSRGRVFLAGDAAHLSPPFAGQGLVSGLRDAANLAWKLAWVVSGRADATILNSYDQERRPHATRMIALARRMGWLVMPRTRFIALLVHGAVKLLRSWQKGRALIDDMQLKPSNSYGRGLFRPGRGAVRRGSWFPQGTLRDAMGKQLLSDEVFGAGFALVSLGIPGTKPATGSSGCPCPKLSADTRDAWTAMGGCVVRVCPKGTPPPPEAFEDVDGAFARALSAGRGSWCVVLRPDRTILHDGPAEAADRLVREAMQLICPPSKPT
jgi:3-(3-hydroxy-phenyl)propionate hydroxylase